MRYRPPIVAQVDPLRIYGRRPVQLPVGLVPWEADQQRTTVVVKTSYRYDRMAAEPQLVLMAEQPGFSVAGPSARPGAVAAERSAPDDLVMVKPRADVLVLGHAFARAPAQAVRVHLLIAEHLKRSADVRAHQPLAEIPLTGAFLQPEGDAPAPPLGPVEAREVIPTAEQPDGYGLTDEEKAAQYEAAMKALYAGEWKPWEDAGVEPPVMADPSDVPEASAALLHGGAGKPDEGVSWDDLYATESIVERGQQFAAPAMTCGFIEPDARIEMQGLTPGGDRVALALPGHDVLVIAEASTRYDVRMEIDTLLLDTDGVVSLTWRGQVPEDLFSRSDVRLVVALAKVDKAPEVEEILNELPRGHFSRAQVPEWADTQPIVGHDVQLASARQMTFHRTPAPLLSLEQYAEVAAQLAAAPKRRVEVLAEHDMDGSDWMLEERAWLERVGSALSRGDMAAVSLYNKTLAKRRKHYQEKQAR